tara:strand:- start:10172 stop:10669 length:498 start_codon:yes stop_codon:yes gene_type:complete
MTEPRVELADGLIASIWETAKSFRKSGEEIVPIAQVWSLQNSNVVFVNQPPNTGDPDVAKDLWADGIREAKKVCTADLILMVTEAWVSPESFGLEALNLHMHGVPIRELPGRREVLLLSAETSWGEQRTLMCEIKDNQLSQEDKDTGWEPLTATGRLSGWFLEEL